MFSRRLTLQPRGDRHCEIPGRLRAATGAIVEAFDAVPSRGGTAARSRGWAMRFTAGLTARRYPRGQHSPSVAELAEEGEAQGARVGARRVALAREVSPPPLRGGKGVCVRSVAARASPPWWGTNARTAVPHVSSSPAHITN